MTTVEQDICVGCEEFITADNGPQGTYDGRFILCGPCGEKVRKIQAVERSNREGAEHKRSRAEFLKKYPSFAALGRSRE